MVQKVESLLLFVIVGNGVFTVFVRVICSPIFVSVVEYG